MPYDFGTLYYSDERPRFVGRPIEDITATNDLLSERYKQNKEAILQLKTVANNTPTLPGDKGHVKNAINDIEAKLQKITDSGDYSMAGQTIQDAAFNFINNPILKEAKSVYANQMAYIKDIKDKQDIYMKSGGKDAGGISSDDGNFLIQKAQIDNNNKTVQLDENGKNLTTYKYETPVKFQDIPKISLEIMDKVKANIRDLDIERLNSIYKFKVSSKEEITAKQINDAVKGVLSTNNQYNDYIKFQAKKDQWRATINSDGTHRDYTKTDFNELNINVSDDNNNFTIEKPVYKTEQVKYNGKYYTINSRDKDGYLIVDKDENGNEITTTENHTYLNNLKDKLNSGEISKDKYNQALDNYFIERRVLNTISEISHSMGNVGKYSKINTSYIDDKASLLSLQHQYKKKELEYNKKLEEQKHTILKVDTVIASQNNATSIQDLGKNALSAQAELKKYELQHQSEKNYQTTPEYIKLKNDRDIALKLYNNMDKIGKKDTKLYLYAQGFLDNNPILAKSITANDLVRYFTDITAITKNRTVGSGMNVRVIPETTSTYGVHFKDKLKKVEIDKILNNTAFSSQVSDFKINAQSYKSDYQKNLNNHRTINNEMVITNFGIGELDKFGNPMNSIAQSTLAYNIIKSPSTIYYDPLTYKEVSKEQLIANGFFKVDANNNLIGKTRSEFGFVTATGENPKGINGSITNIYDNGQVKTYLVKSETPQINEVYQNLILNSINVAHNRNDTKGMVDGIGEYRINNLYNTEDKDNLNKIVDVFETGGTNITTTLHFGNNQLANVQMTKKGKYYEVLYKNTGSVIIKDYDKDNPSIGRITDPLVALAETKRLLNRQSIGETVVSVENDRRHEINKKNNSQLPDMDYNDISSNPKYLQYINSLTNDPEDNPSMWSNLDFYDEGKTQKVSNEHTHINGGLYDYNNDDIIDINDIPTE